MHITHAFEARQLTTELSFPGKDAFDDPKALLKHRRLKASLAAPLRHLVSTGVLALTRKDPLDAAIGLPNIFYMQRLIDDLNDFVNILEFKSHVYYLYENSNRDNSCDSHSLFLFDSWREARKTTSIRQNS